MRKVLYKYVRTYIIYNSTEEVVVVCCLSSTFSYT